MTTVLMFMIIMMLTCLGGIMLLPFTLTTSFAVGYAYIDNKLNRGVWQWR